MTSIVPSSSSKSSLAARTWAYHQQLLESEHALAYLSSRQITKEAIEAFRLGYVGSPSSGDEHYRGRIAIPYLTTTGPVSIRFRRIGDGEGAKILSEHGDSGRPYNVAALSGSDQPVYITEGELDAISMWIAGLPAVAFPGAKSWLPVFGRLFRMREVVIVADGDDPGLAFAHRAATDLEQYRIIQCPHGEDANSILIEGGPEALRKLVGRG